MTQTTPTPTKPKRGDLIVLAETSRTAMIGAAREPHTTVRLGVITSVSRDGIPQKWRTPSFQGAEPRDERIPRGDVHLVTKDRVHVDAVLQGYAAHTWPDSTMVRPFDTLNEAKALLREHRA